MSTKPGTSTSRLANWLGANSATIQPMAPQILLSLNNNVLSLYVRPEDWFTSGCCATLHLQIECAAAADFNSR